MTAHARFIKEMWCDMAEEEAHGRECSGDNGEVGFDENPLSGVMIVHV